jgi:hypothetical protein
LDQDQATKNVTANNVPYDEAKAALLNSAELTLMSQGNCNTNTNEKGCNSVGILESGDQTKSTTAAQLYRGEKA